jgi:hypothetical protein
MDSEKTYFKAFIRVVKSLIEHNGYYGTETIVREPLILAKDKANVKDILLNKYPHFFPKDKVYERESKKDKAQFFYVVIYPLYKYELDLIKEGEWKCASCGQVHENKYIDSPRKNERLFGDNVLFCRSDDDICYNSYLKKKYSISGDIPDDTNFIKKDSLNYIYKITEKSTSKSYIGKTRNAPFFRWWNHLTHSRSPFGMYLRQTKLSNWTFEVLEELPPSMSDSEVLRIESTYILKYDSIKNGFNTLISDKSVVPVDQLKLYDDLKE